MKRIIYTRPDGGLSVVTPVINTYPVREDITEDQTLERAMVKLPADALNVRVVEAADIPADRSYRNAWKDTGSGMVTHDMAKAREIHKNKLRELRGQKLAALDIDYLRADEVGNATLKAQIAQQKQTLRDVTIDPAITAAQTVEELKLAIPEVLL